MVSILSPSKGNKKYSSSAVTRVLEKLSTNFGMNCSTELRVLFDSNKQFNDDCLKEKSGLIKLLNSKFEFFEFVCLLNKFGGKFKIDLISWL